MRTSHFDTCVHIVFSCFYFIVLFIYCAYFFFFFCSDLELQTFEGLAPGFLRLFGGKKSWYIGCKRMKRIELSSKRLNVTYKDTFNILFVMLAGLKQISLFFHNEYWLKFLKNPPQYEGFPKEKSSFFPTGVHIWHVRTLLAILHTFWLSSLCIISIFVLIFYKVVDRSILKGYIFQVAFTNLCVQMSSKLHVKIPLIYPVRLPLFLWSSLTS